MEQVNAVDLNLEERLESWLEQDISILSTDLLVIGRQVKTDFGGSIDLLCLHRDGSVVVVELKRDKTPRDVVAQVLDYASWVDTVSHEQIRRVADEYRGRSGANLSQAFEASFGEPLPDVINDDHSMIVVGSEIDAGTERIIQYLSSRYGVNLNAATFSFFCDHRTQAQYLARVFLTEPEEMEQRAQRGPSTKRQPPLSFEELREAAERAGVGGLYETLVSGLSSRLHPGTTRSSIRFTARFGKSTKVVVSLLPKDSNPEKGLQFQAYSYRLKQLLQRDLTSIEACFPESRQPWKLFEGADEDFSGLTGYFRTTEEVGRFLTLFGCAKDADKAAASV